MSELILYHGTDPANLPSILTEGLRTNSGGWLYLTPMIEEARCHGKAVLRVRVPEGIRLSYFDGCEDWELLCWGPIPPGCIEVLECKS